MAHTSFSRGAKASQSVEDKLAAIERELDQEDLDKSVEEFQRKDTAREDAEAVLKVLYTNRKAHIDALETKFELVGGVMTVVKVKLEGPIKTPFDQQIKTYEKQLNTLKEQIAVLREQPVKVQKTPSFVPVRRGFLGFLLGQPDPVEEIKAKIAATSKRIRELELEIPALPEKWKRMQEKWKRMQEKYKKGGSVEAAAMAGVIDTNAFSDSAFINAVESCGGIDEYIRRMKGVLETHQNYNEELIERLVAYAPKPVATSNVRPQR